MKEILLSQGFVALVDDEDFERLNRFKWSAAKRGCTTYAQRSVAISLNKRRIILMHREILGLTDPNITADHKDHCGWNNQRSNLRAGTQPQNCANQRARGGASRFKGVVWHKQRQRWGAQIKVNYKNHHLGMFDTEEEAAQAYDAAARQASGDFALLNFGA